MRLTVDDHDRDKAGLTYVYPVVSRRAGGVSIGLNLNPNNACNWRCVYCQVPGLVRGAAPELDLARLEEELRTLLARARTPEWLEAHVPEGARRLNDVALSGNGEPTTSEQLGAVLAIVERVLREFELLGRIKVVLITNGSLVHLPRVQAALRHLAQLDGEVWFKLDAVSERDRQRINDARGSAAKLPEQLAACALACPTWVQTMALDYAGASLADEAEQRYVEFLRSAQRAGAQLRGVLLYGLARVSHQPEARQLKPLSSAELDALGARIHGATGLEVRVSA